MAQEGAAVGAAVGTAIMPGVGTAVGGLLGGFLDKKSNTGGVGGYSPTSSSAAVYGSGLDGSGWNVNFGGTQTNGSNKAGQPSLMDSLGVGSAAQAIGIGSMSPLVIIGVLGLVGVILWKRSGSKK